MIRFEVEDMTCGHCAASITKAVQAIDRGARVDVDLASRVVTVDGEEATPQDVARAIEDAGFTPVPRPAASADVKADGQGSCCGRQSMP